MSRVKQAQTIANDKRREWVRSPSNLSAKKQDRPWRDTLNGVSRRFYCLQRVILLRSDICTPSKCYLLCKTNAQVYALTPTINSPIRTTPIVLVFFYLNNTAGDALLFLNHIHGLRLDLFGEVWYNKNGKAVRYDSWI